jgi:hypothetical protein
VASATASARNGAAAAPAFQMSPPKQRKQVAAAPTVAPVARKLAPSAAAAPAQPLTERVANGQNFSKNSSSPALRKVSESLDKLRSELHAVRAQKEMAERTTKIDRLVDDEPTETRRIVQDFSDDEHGAVDATERFDEDVEDEDDDDIVVSLPTAAAAATAATAPKTPSAADMRARARAIDAAAAHTKSPAAPTVAIVAKPMSLEQRVAALERELAEEREARRALERKIAHLLK